MTTPALAPADALEPLDTTDVLDAVQDDVLVEDVSIDGMCGVY